MSASRAPRPLRVLLARMRWLRGRFQHHRELRRGRHHQARADRTPIFVLGAPRSGTTLLHQLLVEGLEVGWLANAHAVNPDDISRIERRDRPRAARTPTAWASNYGATTESWEPNEAEGFWYRFVPRRPHELAPQDVSRGQVAAVRAAVREFAASCGAPVVFKNVYNSLRIPLLAAALPEARYVLIERELETNARSLLAGRVKHGDPQAWFSAEPAGADAVRSSSPGAQVTWQVRRMNDVARARLGELAPEQSYAVSYEQLCRDPRGVLAAIHAWLRESGVDVELRAVANVPAQFEVRAGGRLDDALEQDLSAALASAPVAEDAP